MAKEIKLIDNFQISWTVNGQELVYVSNVEETKDYKAHKHQIKMVVGLHEFYKTFSSEVNVITKLTAEKPKKWVDSICTTTFVEETYPGLQIVHTKKITDHNKYETCMVEVTLESESLIDPEFKTVERTKDYSEASTANLTINVTKELNKEELEKAISETMDEVSKKIDELLSKRASV